MISQNNSVSLNIKPTEGQEGIPKKKDWSKILSAQEKLKQTASSENSVSGGSNQFILNKKEKKQIIKNEKKMTKQLTQLLDQQCQHLTQNIPYENQGNKEIDFDSLNQMGIDQEVSPSDFISQNLLNSIFEPADIETHLIQFYIAQMNLEQLISQRKNYELNEVSPYMQSQMQKKKKLSVDSTSSANNNLMNNISCSQLSHSTAISNTSPSSSAFSAPRYNQNKIALPQPNNFAAVQQNRTQQLQQKQMRNQSLKENTQEIGQIAEYQQSLLLFNLLSSLSNNSGQQQQSQDLPINNRQSTPSMKDISSPKFNNNLANNNNNAQQDLSNDLETELLKHLLLNLEQKQTNEFQSQYPSQDILSQKQNNSTSNNFKMPSVPNCFNSKNEQQSLNFTSTEEDEDDENYNFSLLQKQLMQVLTQQPQKQNQNQAILQSLKNARC